MALSRVTNVNQLSVLLPAQGDDRVENIVYSEMLLSPNINS